MPLDINSFRSIANRSPDEFVYAQGETLKTSRSGTTHGAHTYKAATDAFVKACIDHYGVPLGEAIRKHLEADGNGGTPLTARKIKALVAFADDRLGSGSCVKVGDATVNLAKLGTDKMLSKGFLTSTKIRNAQTGGANAASATFTALAPAKSS